MGGRQRTAVFSILAAGLLVALKLGVGAAVGSLALVSAGIESSGDVVAALLTLLAVRAAVRPADREHPFGHGRAENLAALGEAAILTGGGIFIVVEAARRLTGADTTTPQAAWYVFAVVAAAMALDASRALISLRTARRYGSAALRSNAFHFAGDFGGSVAVLIGLAFVALGQDRGDAIAALVVAAIIFAAAARLVWENAETLMDRVPPGADARAREAIEALDPPVELRRLRVREAGGQHFADVVVGVPPDSAVAQGHAAADAVERAVEAALPGSDTVVHVEPAEEQEGLRERVLAAALSVRSVREAHNVTIIRGDDGTVVTLHVKLPSTLPLAEAHAMAGEVEQAIRSVLPGVVAVHTHVEPLTEPIAGRSAEPARIAGLAERIHALARASTGAPPRALRFIETGRGIVVLLTLDVPADVSLARAHRIASEVEEAVHAHEDVADVVVHTEPAG